MRRLQTCLAVVLPMAILTVILAVSGLTGAIGQQAKPAVAWSFIASILLGPVYPWKWKKFTVGPDAPVEWNGGKDRAVARLDGGKAGEIVLAHNPTAMSPEPTVIKNLKYFAAPRNDGFVLMPAEV